MAARRRANPYDRAQMAWFIAAAVLGAATVLIRLPMLGLWLAAAIVAKTWPKPEMFDLETPGQQRAMNVRPFGRHVLWPFSSPGQPFGVKMGFGPSGSGQNEAATHTPPLRVSSWLGLLFAIAIVVVELAVVPVTMPLAPLDGLFALLLWQGTAAGLREAAHPAEGVGFPAAMWERPVAEQVGIPVLGGAGVFGLVIGAAAGWFLPTLISRGTTLTVSVAVQVALAVVLGLMLGAVGPAAMFIRQFNEPIRDHLAKAEAWQQRWMMIPKIPNLPPFVGEHAVPPPDMDPPLPETHRFAFFGVPPGTTIEDFRSATDKLTSAIATKPGEAEYVLIAPMQKTDAQGRPIPGTRSESTFSVAWNTEPLPHNAHLQAGLDNWTMRFVVQRAFDRAFVALKLGMFDFVKVTRLHREGTPNAMYETIWSLPPGITFDKVATKARDIGEKVGAEWLRIGRHTKDFHGRKIPDGYLSICFGTHPDRVTLENEQNRAFIEALELEASFHALGLGSPLLERSESLSMPPHPALVESQFHLDSKISWADVIKKTSALMEKLDIPYLRVTRRMKGNQVSSLVSVIYGADPNDTVLLTDPPGFGPGTPTVGHEENADRLFLDGVDWDLWFRSCKLIGVDGTSPSVVSKFTNDQQVSTYKMRMVPGLDLTKIQDGVGTLRATSGLGYIEIDKDDTDASYFRLLAGKIDPLDRPYMFIDHQDEVKPGDPHGFTVLHDPVPGVPDITWCVGPGADGELMIDKFESDNPHLFVGGGSGSGKALALDTLIPTPDGWRKFGDLAVGDTLFDEAGNPCTVVDQTPIWHGRPVCEVEFDDGTVITADDNHEWLVHDTHTRKNTDHAEARTTVTDPSWVAQGAAGLRAMQRGDGHLLTLVEMTAELGGYSEVLHRAMKHAGVEPEPLRKVVPSSNDTRPRAVPSYSRDELLGVLADRAEQSLNAFASPQMRNDDQRVVTTEEMAQEVVDAFGKRQWSIDVAGPLELPEADLPIDPYLLGALLGAGGMSQPNTLTFTSADPAVAKQVADAMPVDTELVHDGGYSYRVVRVGDRMPSSVQRWLSGIGVDIDTRTFGADLDTASVLAGAYAASPHVHDAMMVHPEDLSLIETMASTIGVQTLTSDLPYHDGVRHLVRLPNRPAETDHRSFIAGVCLIGVRRRDDGLVMITPAAGRIITPDLPDDVWLGGTEGHGRWLACEAPKMPTTLKQALIDLGLLGTSSAAKHLPDQYLRASIDQRLAALQGLMDTGGHISVGGHSEFRTTSPRLADAVLELARSLGIKASAADGRAALDGVVVTPRRCVTWTSNAPTFRLPRKAERVPAQTDPRVRRRYVAAITRVESVPVRCIEVDSPSHLFLASEAMVPTHNSVTILAFILQFLHNNTPEDVKFTLIDPKTELIFFENAAHVDHFLGLTTPGFAANPYGAVADLLESMKDETYRRNTEFVSHPATPQNLSQARWIARQEIDHARSGTTPAEWPVGHSFPWWDGEPEDHPFMLPYRFIVIEECSTFFKQPANKEHRDDHERVVGMTEELARIARSAGVFMIYATQYPKKENVSTTLLAQSRRIGLFMNRVGSMLTIEEPGLQDIKTPGRGKMSANKSYRGVRCLYVRVPDEKNPDVTDDRAAIYSLVAKKNRSSNGMFRPDEIPTAGPTVVAAPPPSPEGLWHATGAQTPTPDEELPQAEPPQAEPPQAEPPVTPSVQDDDMFGDDFDASSDDDFDTFLKGL